MFEDLHATKRRILALLYIPGAIAFWTDKYEVFAWTMQSGKCTESHIGHLTIVLLTIVLEPKKKHGRESRLKRQPNQVRSSCFARENNLDRY